MSSPPAAGTQQVVAQVLQQALLKLEEPQVPATLATLAQEEEEEVGDVEEDYYLPSSTNIIDTTNTLASVHTDSTSVAVSAVLPATSTVPIANITFATYHSFSSAPKRVVYEDNTIKITAYRTVIYFGWYPKPEPVPEEEDLDFEEESGYHCGCYTDDPSSPPDPEVGEIISFRVCLKSTGEVIREYEEKRFY